MTLRLRLTLALLALVTVGLGAFGVVTYSLYSRAQYAQLDERLRASIPPLTGQLTDQGGPGTPPRMPGAGPGPGGTGGGRAGTPMVIPPDTYAELRDANGKVLEAVQLSSSSEPSPSSLPLLPASLPTEAFTTRSVDGTGEWRVISSHTDRPAGARVVVATPLEEVHSSLDRLVLIEGLAALALLALLGSGSWLILRRGLAPLEHMATQARSITAGDLSQRVEPAEPKTEVGELGLALNTMLEELEVAFREREATERRLRQFLADASHELRTPLTSIQGFAELSRLGADQDRVDHDVIQRRIEEESARMKVLVEDLLLLARLDETRPIEREPVDLAVLAADACSDAVAAAPDRRITLDAPEPVVVPGDRDHLRQAITNLVANAVKHTPDTTQVEVGAAVQAGRAVVTVRDHGPGLDATALEHVFDRFWQADQARVGTGAGLGLSIVAGIAQEHGGTVEATNMSDGGASFALRLPLDAP